MKPKQYTEHGTHTVIIMCCLIQVKFWFLTKIVLTKNSYKKNIAYELLRKLSKSIYEANPTLQTSHNSIKSLEIKEVVENVCSSYQNSNNLDKVAAAHRKVDQVTSVMQENVKGMVKNIEDAEVS